MTLIQFLHHILRQQADRRAARIALGRLLTKPDDHLIADIGLTRAEVEALHRQGGEPAARPPKDDLNPCRGGA